MKEEINTDDFVEKDKKFFTKVEFKSLITMLMIGFIINYFNNIYGSFFLFGASIWIVIFKIFNTLENEKSNKK